MENYRHDATMVARVPPAVKGEENDVPALRPRVVEGENTMIGVAGLAGVGDDLAPILDMTIVVVAVAAAAEEAAEVMGGEDIAVVAMATMTIITTVAVGIMVVVEAAVADHRTGDHRHRVAVKAVGRTRHTLPNDTRNSQCYANFCGRRRWRRIRPN